MNRELKFRAWDKKRKRMRFDLPAFYFIKTMEEPLDRENFEVMQYTGLLDKNGKEIFEGDLIRHYWVDEYKGTSLDRREVIERVPGGFINRPLNDKEKKTDYSLVHADNWNFEVIGNVWENPELLEEEKQNE